MIRKAGENICFFKRNVTVLWVTPNHEKTYGGVSTTFASNLVILDFFFYSMKRNKGNFIDHDEYLSKIEQQNKFDKHFCLSQLTIKVTKHLW